MKSDRKNVPPSPMIREFLAVLERAIFAGAWDPWLRLIGTVIVAAGVYAVLRYLP